SIPRPNGAERDQYIKDERLALPTNQPFRDVSELLNVEGVTPEIYQKIVPYLTTRGSGIININSADTVVLRALPGMTDRVLVQILSLRSGGRRINSLAQVMAGGGTRFTVNVGRGGPVTGANITAQDAQLTAATTVDVREVE